MKRNKYPMYIYPSDEWVWHLSVLLLEQDGKPFDAPLHERGTSISNSEICKTVLWLNNCVCTENCLFDHHPLDKQKGRSYMQQKWLLVLPGNKECIGLRYYFTFCLVTLVALHYRVQKFISSFIPLKHLRVLFYSWNISPPPSTPKSTKGPVEPGHGGPGWQQRFDLKIYSNEH